MHNFENWKCRASMAGVLLVEPKEKAAKDRGELSATAKDYLINVYIKEKYGREVDISTKQMEKGTICEPDGIKLLCEVDGLEYKKNHERLENEWFSGSPDVYLGESVKNATEIWDNKSPWSMNTFLSNLTKPLNPLYRTQIQVYMELSNTEQGGVAYTLVNAPQNMIEDELFYLSKRMGVIDTAIYNPEYELAAAKLQLSMMFDDISPKEKVLKFPVTRDRELIEKLKGKVEKGREFLQELDSIHTNFNT